MEINNYKEGEVGVNFTIKGSLNKLAENRSIFSVVSNIREIVKYNDLVLETTPDKQNTNVRINFTPSRQGIPGEIIERLQQIQCPILYLEKKNNPIQWPTK